MAVDFTTLEKLFEARKAAKHYFNLHPEVDKSFEYNPAKIANDTYETKIIEEILRLAKLLKPTKS